MKKRTFVSFVVVALMMSGGFASAAEYLSGIEWAEPAVIDPGGPEKAPSDAIVLFDGTDLSQFDGAKHWTVNDGAITAGRAAGRIP